MWTRTPFTAPALVVVLLLTACGGGSVQSRSDLVARADDHGFTVDEAADLMNGQSTIPHTEPVVRALSNLWIDYTLLAEEAASDSTLADLDVGSLVEPQLEQELVLALRDSAVHPDTSFTDAELRQAFESDDAGVQVHARHILLTFPPNATEAQQDSVRKLARDLRKRASAGEDFGDLARQYSKDPGSAPRGGDLGFFGHGQMVPAFEKAAFALDSGEISQPVQTRFGIHLIEVEGRKSPTFEDNREAVANRLRQRRTYAAESTYVAGIADSAGIEVTDDAVSVVRDIAADPGMELTGRARNRALVHYEGGEVTAGEVQSFLQGRSPQELDQIKQASDQQAQVILNNLARRELLLSTARSAGLTLPEGRADSLRAQIRGRLRQAMAEVGLNDLQPEEGETRSQAIDRTVHDVLVQTLASRKQVIPLGKLSYALRRRHDAQLYPAGVSRVVEQISDSTKSDGTGGAPGTSGGAGRPPPGTAGGPGTDSTP